MTLPRESVTFRPGERVRVRGSEEIAQVVSQHGVAWFTVRFSGANWLFPHDWLTPVADKDSHAHTGDVEAERPAVEASSGDAAAAADRSAPKRGTASPGAGADKGTPAPPTDEEAGP